MAKQFRAGRSVVTVAAVLLAGIAPLLLSCGDDEEPAGPTTPTFTYPHANGSEWTYAYEGVNAVKYVISGTFQHPAAGNTQQLITYLYYDGWERYDTDYLKVTENDMRLYLDDTSSDYYMLLKFPLAVGNQWNAGNGYTANVSSKEKTSVPAGSFDCYKIDYTSSGGSMTFWWPSNVGGMGAKNYGLWYAGTTPITIELKSYNLPT